MKNRSNLPVKLQTEVESFFELAQSQRLSRNLRTLLLNYLCLQQDGHGMSIEDLLTDMQWLFALLDMATDELEYGARAKCSVPKIRS